MAEVNKIFPFRAVYDQPETTDCEICGVEINPLQGYAVMANGVVDGYVCHECFEQSEDCEQESPKGIVFAIPYNPATIN